MQRTPFWSERIQMIDPYTGVRVIQITGYPLPSNPLAYDWPNVTPDNRRVFFMSQRFLGRNAPWDIWRCDTDGLNIFQLTEYAPIDPGIPMRLDGTAFRPTVRMTLDGAALLVAWPGETAIHRLDVETGDDRVVADLAETCTDGSRPGPLFIMPDERLLIGLRAPTGQRMPTRWIRLDLATGRTDEFPTDGFVMGCDFVRNRVILLRNPWSLGTTAGADGSRVYTNTNPRPMSAWSCDFDGGDLCFLSPWLYAHGTPLGRTGAMHGPGHPPDRCVWVVEPDSEPVKVAEGPYFWHSGASFDGEWVISDTNWPDEGLKLIHVPTRRWKTLCRAGATEGHTQMGHPHPCLSADGRVAVFGSDRTGVRQIYVVRIEDEFRERVKAGEVDRPRDKWM